MSKKCSYALLSGIATFVLLAGNSAFGNLPDANVFLQSSTPPTEPGSEVPVGFPQKIWQSWKDDSEDPTDRTAGFPQQWRVVNPGWNYERITDAAHDAYVRRHFSPLVGGLFTSLDDPILKADYLRYLVLLREGGVWADIDVFPHWPVSEWIPERLRGEANLVVGIENDHHKRPIRPGSPYSVQLCQHVVLAKPDHPAMRAVVDQVTWNLDQLLQSKVAGGVTTFEDVMTATGPFAFTKALMDYFAGVTGVEHAQDELDRLEQPRLIGDVLVLPKDAFGWLPQEHTCEKGDPATLAEHLFIGSWRKSHPG